MPTPIHTAIKYAVADYLNQPAGRPVSVLILDKPGSGKSTVIETVLPKVLENGLFPNQDGADPETRPEVPGVIHWSPNGCVAVVTENTITRDVIDLRGVLAFKRDGTSFYTTPDLPVLIQSLYDAGAQVVVLFLDELLNNDQLMMKGLCDVLLNHRFGGVTLDPRTWVVAASNKQNHGGGANRALTILTNRVNMIETMTPVFNPANPNDSETWHAWARKAGMLNILLSFAETHGGAMQVDIPPKEGPFPSLRSFTFAASWLKSFKASIRDDDPNTLPMGAADDPDRIALHSYAFNKVAGFVGEELAAKLNIFANTANVLPRMQDILKDPVNAPLPPQDRSDAMFIMARNLISATTVLNLAQIWTYAERMPRELQVTMANRMIANVGNTALGAPNFAAWAAKNRALLAASGI